MNNNFKYIRRDFLNDLKNRDSEKILSDTDKKIINLLAKESIESDLKSELFLFDVVFQLKILEKKIKKYPELWDYLLLHVFCDLYELTLYIIDRKLVSYIKNNKIEDKEISNFLKLNRKGSSHATAEKINKTICKILNLSEDNDSIFGSHSKTREIRNAVNHANFDTVTNYNLKENYNRVYAFLKCLIYSASP